jgi:hypothetical protein
LGFLLCLLLHLIWFLCCFSADSFVQCAGHLAGGSSVSTSVALARRRREIRMGKRPILLDGMSFAQLYIVLIMQFVD